MISSILRGWGRKECKTSNDLVVGPVGGFHSGDAVPRLRL